MGSPLVVKSSPTLCDHGAQGQNPSRTSTRVKVGGEPVVLAPSQYTVSGCPLTTPPPPSSPIPCTQLNFTTGSTRIMIENAPPLLLSSKGMAIGSLPVQGSGTITASQPRVTGI